MLIAIVLISTFQTRSLTVAQADLELSISGQSQTLGNPPRCWHIRHEPPCLLRCIERPIFSYSTFNGMISNSLGKSFLISLYLVNMVFKDTLVFVDVSSQIQISNVQHVAPKIPPLHLPTSCSQPQKGLISETHYLARNMAISSVTFQCVFCCCNKNYEQN